VAKPNKNKLLGQVGAAARPSVNAPQKSSKPDKTVSLHESYKLHVSPAEQNAQHPVTLAELNALDALHQNATGSAAPTGVDARSIAHSAGLIHAIGGARGAVAGAGGLVGIKNAGDLSKNPVFASAVDALDWLNSQNNAAGDAIDRRVQRFKDVWAKDVAVSDKAISAAENAVLNVPIPGQRGRTSTLGGGLSQAGENVAHAAGVVRDVRNKIVQASAPGKGQMSGGGARGGGAPVTVGGVEGGSIIGGINKVISGISSPFNPTVFAPQVTPSGALYVNAAPNATLGDVNNKSIDIAKNTNNYVDATSKIHSGYIPGSSVWISRGMDASRANGDPNAIRIAMENGAVNIANAPLQPYQDLWLRKWAKDNGWDTSSWNGVPPEDKIYQATTSNNTAFDYWKQVARSVARTAGETGAAPAGIEAAGVAAYNLSQGDTAETKQLISAAIAPYKHFVEIAKTQGLTAAMVQFFRDDPTQALVALNAAAKALGVAGGIAARTGVLGKAVEEYAQVNARVHVPGEAVNIHPTPQELPPLEPGSNLVASGVERLRIQRENAARANDFRRTGVSPAQHVDVTVGYTGPNILSTIIQKEFKRRLAERNRWYRDRLLRKKGFTQTRLEGNVTQGLGIQIQSTIQNSIKRRLTRSEQDRLAWELSRPGETIGGVANTPGFEASFYATEIKNLQDAAASADRALTLEERQQIQHWQNSVDALSSLDKVLIGGSEAIHNEVLGRVRSVAKKYGDTNTQIIADALNISLKEAKRRDYLRSAVVDKKLLETKAFALKASKNTGIVQLVKVQRNVKRSAEAITKYASETGWGSYGKAASRLRFSTLRAQLVNDLILAEKLSKDAGHLGQAAKYADARRKLVTSSGGSVESKALLDSTLADLSSMQASAETVAALPQAAQEAYVAAQAATPAVEAAAADVAAAEAAHIANIAAAGVKKVDSRMAGLAEQRLQLARERLASVESFPNADQAMLDKARNDVVNAESVVQQYKDVQASIVPLRSARQSLVEATKARDAKLAEAKRIVESQVPVLDTNEVTAAINASGDIASIRVRTKRQYDYYTIDRARGEVLDAFIARVEAVDKGVVLHLMQRREMRRIGSPVFRRGDKKLDTSAMGGPVRSGRFKSSDGYLFASGQESFDEMWKRLLFDTSELITAKHWRDKMDQLIEATSIRYRFTPETLAEADRMVVSVNEKFADPASLDPVAFKAYEVAKQDALGEIIRAQGVEYSVNDFQVVNLKAPNSKFPSSSTSVGNAPNVNPDSISMLMWRSLNERTIDPNAPGDYFLVPRAVYTGIQDAIRQESFRLTPETNPVLYKLDSWTKQWRTFTLNILPRTAFNNFAGSAILAVQAGAGPRAFWFAFKALKNEEHDLGGLPIPPELRQRYYEQLFTPGDISRSGAVRQGVAEGSLLDSAYAFGGWYMNSMRKLNGMSEDFGRLAVWYSKAYPEAMRSAEGARFFDRMRGLTDNANAILRDMANGDPAWAVKHQEWMKQSFDFLGDLHRGGRLASTLRIGIPFYQWYAHMLKLTFFTMPVKYPGRDLFLQMLSDIGQQYQQDHGVNVPWGWDFLPYHTGTVMVNGQPQDVTSYTSSMNWYPQNTISSLFDRQGKPSLSWITQTFNPLLSNAALIGLSAGAVAAGSPAKDPGYSDWTRAAKDEYGNDVNKWPGFFAYAGNKLFSMFPLSPVIMSMSGRASTALPFPGSMAQKPQGAIPSVSNPPVDVMSLLGDGFDLRNVGLFLLKATTNISTNNMYGLGPAYAQRLQKEYAYAARLKTREDANVAKALRQSQQGMYPQPQVQIPQPEAPNTPPIIGGTNL